LPVGCGVEQRRRTYTAKTGLDGPFAGALCNRSHVPCGGAAV